MAIAILQGVGGRVPQDKSIKIERDGIYRVTADEGYELEAVEIVVDTPDKKPETELDLGKITTNGIQEHIPPEGSVYSKVSLDVSVLNAETFDERLDGIIALQNGYIGSGYKPSEGLEYRYEGKSYVVIGRGSCTDSVVVIPSTYDDGVNGEHRVISIGFKNGGYGETNGAFYNDKLLEELILPESRVSFDAYIFSGSNLRILRNFASCTSFALDYTPLEYVSFLPDVDISNYEFFRKYLATYDFSRNTRVSVLTDAEYIGVAEDTKIIVPANLVDEWKSASNWTAYADHIVAADEVSDYNTTEERLEAIEGNVEKVYEAGEEKYKGYKIDLAALIDRSITEIEIPEGVTKIGDYCFLLCSDLKKITIPNTVTHIGGYALGFNALTSLDIPDSVIEIGTNAIYNSPLKSITFGKNLSKISENNFNSMRNCVSYDFSRCEQVPQMTGDCFKNINSEAKIYVPSALYDEWIAETNWTTYASYIVAK